MPPPEVADILRLARADWKAEQLSKVTAYHRSIEPKLSGLRQLLALAQKTKDDFEATVPHCLVSVASDKPREVRILPRGNWMIETGEIVTPALPTYLAGERSDRAAEV